MADNPYGYGQYPGFHQSGVPFSHSSSVPSGSQPQLPFYTESQMATMASNYEAMENSFNYNASRIPGLGLGATSFSATPSQPNVNQIWQPQAQLPPPSTFAPSMRAPAATAKPSPPAPQTQTAHSQPTQNDPQRPGSFLEEGELDDSEFEDLYEPVQTSKMPTSATNNITQPSNLSNNQHDSPGDADGSSIYDAGTPLGEVVITSTSNSLPGAEQEDVPDEEWEPSYPERERSGSYSPYLSPREVQRKLPVPKSHEVSVQQRLQQPPKETAPTSTNQRLNGAHPKSNGTSHDTKTNTSALGISVTQASRPSEQELKKKAQEAILGLWPLNVRYQDYIDEGIDPQIVRDLFTELGLNIPQPKNEATSHKGAVNPNTIIGSHKTSDEDAPEVQKAGESNSSAVAEASATGVATQEKTKPADKPSEVKPAKSAAEERKDKIARKLAAMGKKTTVPSQTSASAQPVESSATKQSTAPAVEEIKPVEPSASKVKTRDEKNALLQQKLAALKAQQAKAAAEKAAAENTLLSATGPSTPNAAAEVTKPLVAGNQQSARSPPKTALGVSAIQDPVSRPASTPLKETGKEGAIPGLSLGALVSSQPIQAPIRNFKRPVASDFDNFPPRGDQLKRSRTQETLIIDVSDDEDVEMDMGSPGDDPGTPLEPTISSARKTPLGAFPPLTDTAQWRQRSSPASSSAQTPPTHGVQLDILAKKIQETKRRIAEAEAKKAAKKPLALQSSQPSSPVAPESARLPKVSESRTQLRKLNFEKRDRIASYELPLVLARLKEKEDKLKEVVAQAAQLQIEIQASMEERQKLTTVMDELVEEPEAAELTDDSGPATLTHTNSTESSERDLEAKQLADQLSETAVKSATAVVDGNEAIIPEDMSIESSSTSDQIMSASESAKSVANDEDVEMDEAPAQNALDWNIERDSQPNSLNAVTQSSSAETIEEATEAIAHQASEDLQREVEGKNVFSNVVDISLQNSEAGLAQEDDSSYEPKPTQISTTNDALVPELYSKELADDVPNEPSPTNAVEEQVLQRQENLTGEVQYHSSREHLLLTDAQAEQEPARSAAVLEPYHSPLGYFRAYRFHPKFFDDVPGGLKSMTYSSRIDPMQELCPQVQVGEHCLKGKTCEYQHFDTMVLSDSEIITQLGSAVMYSGEIRVQFIEGLKRVLNDLKANKVKDFDRITKAIVKHRQDFLDDKTKILPLESGNG
ncbi:hypothetical protein F5Y15DRAFT_226366 [Xylariaceae sp. FL0016]|nr:hypothetical protein F5Y15DRAFT_226366 [Xylariaceae sp. FL0016]